jgi:hypothetical protein
VVGWLLDTFFFFDRAARPAEDIDPADAAA